MENLQSIANQIRRDIVRMVYEVQSGHPGGSLGCTDFFTALYFKIMNHSPNFTMNGINEDLFFLSNGHISPVFYSSLAHSGYFDKKELSTFRRINSRVQGHPTTHEHLPGIRIASGSLGQGMSVAAGAALAKKLNNDNGIVYSLHGDGELEEGQIWEAALFTAHHKIDNYIATVDWNGQQIDGTTDQVGGLGDLQAKFESFGWKVINLEKGNDIEAIIETLNLAKTFIGKGQPIIILMKTIMGKGVSYMEGKHEWHGTAPNAEQFAIAMQEIPETLGDY